MVVYQDGSVLWIPHRIYYSSCSVDVTNYPFDTQTCRMTFGSWAYHGNEIDLVFYDDLERMDIRLVLHKHSFIASANED